MYFARRFGDATKPSPGPTATADEAGRKLAEQRRDELLRTCNGVTMLQRLDRFSPAARVAYWEMVLRQLPYVLRLKAELAKQVRKGKMNSRKSAEIFNKVFAKLGYPSGYALGSDADEMARARCGLADAQWRLCASLCFKHVPGLHVLPASDRVGEPPAAPPVAADSTVANGFVEAHRSRWCTPGQAGSGVCATLAAPRAIRRVVIHTIASSPTGNPCGRIVTINDIIRGWQRPGREASSHYLVDRDGTVTQMVREANAAFHVVGHNRDTIGIEHADVCNSPAPYTTELYERSAALVRDIASRHGIQLSVFGIDTTDPAVATVFGHVDLGGHGDPGPYWDWEYYARLLRWDGATPGARPMRVVSTAAQNPIVPTTWEARSRVQVLDEARPCIPNDHCASQNHSYGDRYWRAQANTAGSDAVFQFSVGPAGLYKLSLWWPNVRDANPEVQLVAEVLKAGGPARALATVNQRSNSGRWNDIGPPFTFTGPATGAQGTLRIRRTSRQPGWILADALRVLKVG